MKLNNKGISIIEIVLTFSLVMLMVIGMLGIVFNYRDKASVSLKKLDLDTFKNTLTKDIQDDILEYGVQEIVDNTNENGVCLVDSDDNGTLDTTLSNCVKIIFKNGEEKIFGTSKIVYADFSKDGKKDCVSDSSQNAEEKSGIENKFLYYDGIKYELKEKLPNSKTDGKCWRSYQSIEIVDNNILTVDSMVLEDGTVLTLYSIDVYISHFEYEDKDFGIHIVTYAENKTDTDFGTIDNQYFVSKILNDNLLITAEPTLTTSSNNTSDASGLYSAKDVDLGGNTYYFRGDVTNNYVSFAGYVWRIVRINGDGTIKLIKQDAINSNNYIYNTDYEYMGSYYFTSSDIITSVGSWVTSNVLRNYGDYVASGNYYCLSVDVLADSSYTTLNDGMDAFLYTNYKPSFYCDSDRQSKRFYSSNLGLLTYYEAVFAGLYPNKSNYKTYLHNGSQSFYTMSPAGYDKTNSTYTVWVVAHDGSLHGWGKMSGLPSSKALRPVINLKSTTMATGSGTSTDPYVIK